MLCSSEVEPMQRMRTLFRSGDCGVHVSTPLQHDFVCFDASAHRRNVPNPQFIPVSDMIVPCVRMSGQPMDLDEIWSSSDPASGASSYTACDILERCSYKPHVTFKQI
jgi:hypothetical protein